MDRMDNEKTVAPSAHNPVGAYALANRSQVHASALTSVYFFGGFLETDLKRQKASFTYKQVD